MLRWFLQCQIDPVRSVTYHWQRCDSALLAVCNLKTAGLLLCPVEGKTDVDIRSECMNAENLCTTYYLVLLFSMWTPALRCGVYLFTCLCLTLCALHRRSLPCYFQFGWLWWKGYGWAAHFNLSYILVVHTYLCIIGCPLGPAPSCPPSHFLKIFWYNLWLHILPQLFRVSQSFLNRF